MLRGSSFRCLEVTMIEVEDRDPVIPTNIQVSISECEGCAEVSQGNDGELIVHKDTWPALKEAIETTFKQMEAKPIIKTHEDRAAAARIIDAWCRNTAGYTQSFGNKLLEALVRGYV